MSEVLTQINIRMNWSLEVGEGAAYCFQLEYPSKPPVIRQLTEIYNLKPDENLYRRLMQQDEVALHCLVHALNSLTRPCKVSVLATSFYLANIVEGLPQFIETNHFANHRYEVVIKELWDLIQKHQVKYYQQDFEDKDLKAIKTQAKKKALEEKP